MTIAELVELFGPYAASVTPILLLVARESVAWRAELASWRRDLSAARIIIEPVNGDRTRPAPDDDTGGGEPPRAAPAPTDPTEAPDLDHLEGVTILRPREPRPGRQSPPR